MRPLALALRGDRWRRGRPELADRARSRSHAALGDRRAASRSASGVLGGLDVVRDASPRRTLVPAVPGWNGAQYELAWSPDGRTVAFIRRPNDPEETGPGAGLYVVGSDGRAFRRVVSLQGVELSDPAWAADGKTLAFAATCTARPCATAAQLDVVNTRGGAPRAVVTVQRAGATIRSIAWSPSGRRLVYVSASSTGGESEEIRVVARRGSAPRLLASSATEGRLGRVAWSPDGALLAYHRRCIETIVGGDTFCEVAVMAADGSARRTVFARRSGLRKQPSADVPLFWLARSRTLVVPLYGFDGGIAIVDTAKGRYRLLAKSPSSVVATARDVTAIAYVADVAGHQELFVVDPAGRRLTHRRLTLGGTQAGQLWLGR